MFCVIVVLGCRGQTSSEPPIVPLRNMFDQDRYDPQSESKFFADGRTMRNPVQGTVPRERELDPVVARGRLPNDSGYVLEIPDQVIEQGGGGAALIERGHARYDIYCRPCHDGTGGGQGITVQRGPWNPPPPTFHQDRVRQMPDGQLFATISNGVRMMPPYAARIPIQDRWAIVSYVRALQLSQGE
jgi:mono/diheme cytochrome c family protein